DGGAAPVDGHDRRPDRRARGRQRERAGQRERVGSVRLGEPDGVVAPLRLRAAAELDAGAGAEEGRGQRDRDAAEVHGYRGGMRTAPSSRIVSPLSIAFWTISSASEANSGGRPSREGKGIVAASAWRAGSGISMRSGVSNRPGAIVTTRIPSFARSRAIGRVMPTPPAFDAE